MENKKILYFGASWCGPCQQMKPALSRLEEQFHGKLEIIHIDVDKNPEYCQENSITSVPTLLFVENNITVNSLKGFQSEANLKKKFNEFIN